MIKKLLWILLVCFSSNARSQIINEKLVEKHLTTLADDLMEEFETEVGLLSYCEEKNEILDERKFFKAR